MKNNIIRKLRSQTGASLSFALLLFLVCAVLCSVIITAATASSGRMAKMAETDQRYYAVTSAAELLKDVFMEHPTVSVVKVEEKTETTTYTDGVPGTPVAGTTVTKVYVVEDKKATQISENDYKNADGTDKADCLLETSTGDPVSFKNDTIQKDAAKNIHFGTTATIRNRKLTLTSAFSSGAGLGYDALAVDIFENLDENGNITLTLYNHYERKDKESATGSRHTLELELDADTTSTTNTKTKNVSTTALSADSYKVTTKTTTITTTTLTWDLSGIRTVPSD